MGVMLDLYQEGMDGDDDDDDAHILDFDTHFDLDVYSFNSRFLFVLLTMLAILHALIPTVDDPHDLFLTVLSELHGLRLMGGEKERKKTDECVLYC